MTRTYVDTSVFVNSRRGRTQREVDVATAMLNQQGYRKYLSSYFLRLELVPYAVRGGPNQKAERDLLQLFFDHAEDSADVSQVLERTMELLCSVDLGILDAAHIAAAELMDADEIVTADEGFRRAERLVSVKVVVLK